VYFKEFCASLDEAYKTLVLLSHNSIRAWLLTEFAARQANITEELSQSRLGFEMGWAGWGFMLYPTQPRGSGLARRYSPAQPVSPRVRARGFWVG
jgi:hypothetical protein